MTSWFQQLDDLLRGRKTGPQSLSHGRLELPLALFLPLAILFGAVYGFFMGWYGMFSRPTPSYVQMLASMVKLPALYLLTLLVTFPSLYVFNALVGCRLSLGATLRLLVAATVVNVTVAASLGPILGFFTFSTTSYSFMILLNVLLLGIAGAVALGFLLGALRRLAITSAWKPPVVPAGDERPAGNATGEKGQNASSKQSSHTPEYSPDDDPSATLGQARSIFRIWVVIYALVGAQTGWLLRPFIGSPDLEFTWFRSREGNFFLSVFNNIRGMFEAG